MKFIRKQAKKTQRGQAMVEFIAVVVVVFFFLLFMLSMSVLMVMSEYVDFATFMAARTLKSGFGSQDIQERNARIVFDQYVNKVQGLARNFNLEFIQTQPGDVRTSGVRSSYDIDMFYLPPVFLGNDGPTSRIRLQSESHLGRDPSFNECQDFNSDLAGRFGVTDRVVIEQMDDNGC